MKASKAKFKARELHIAAEILGMSLSAGLTAVAKQISIVLQIPEAAHKSGNRSLVRQFNARNEIKAREAARNIRERKKQRDAWKPAAKNIGPLQRLGEPHKDYKRDPDFYSTRQWKELRYLALKNNGARCQCCGASAADGEVIHVDHIEPIYKRPDLKLELDNLQILCSSCNQGKGAWDNTDWRQHMKSI